MRKQKRFNIWIETKSGDKNLVEMNLRHEEIESAIKKWKISRKVYIEDKVLTDKNQKTNKKNKEWGYIEIVETRGE